MLDDRGEKESGTDAGYSATLIAALTRVLAAWTAPEFMTAVAAREGVTLDPGAITMVTILAKDGPKRPSQLAGQMVTGASNISKISARLIAAGLAQRVSDPLDARAQLLELTSSGEHVSAALAQAGAGLVDDLLDGWSDADRLDFSRLLQKFENSTVALATGLVQAPANPLQPTEH